MYYNYTFAFKLGKANSLHILALKGLNSIFNFQSQILTVIAFEFSPYNYKYFCVMCIYYGIFLL